MQRGSGLSFEDSISGGKLARSLLGNTFGTDLFRVTLSEKETLEC
jgi:hypothetical protein